MHFAASAAANLRGPDGSGGVLGGVRVRSAVGTGRRFCAACQEERRRGSCWIDAFTALILSIEAPDIESHQSESEPFGRD